MAFDKTPSTWLAGWSENGTDITVPIATFPEMTAAEADASTGDIRKIMFALIDKLYQTYRATAEANRPGKVSITRTSFPPDSGGVVRHVYQFQFYVETTAQEVEDES